MISFEEQLKNLPDNQQKQVITSILGVAAQVETIFEHSNDGPNIILLTKKMRLHLFDELSKVGILAKTQVGGREVEINEDLCTVDICLGFNGLISAAKKIHTIKSA